MCLEQEKIKYYTTFFSSIDGAELDLILRHAFDAFNTYASEIIEKNDKINLESCNKLDARFENIYTYTLFFIILFANVFDVPYGFFGEYNVFSFCGQSKVPAKTSEDDALKNLVFGELFLM